MLQTHQQRKEPDPQSHEGDDVRGSFLCRPAVAEWTFPAFDDVGSSHVLCSKKKALRA